MLTPATNYPAWKFYLDLLRDVGFVVMGIYVWWSNREKVTSRRFAALEKEVAERIKHSDLERAKEQRDKQCLLHQQDIKDFEKGNLSRLGDAEKTIERIGGEIRNLPQHRHIQELSGRVEQINGGVEKVAGRLDGLARAVDLMNEFLINQGGKH